MDIAAVRAGLAAKLGTVFDRVHENVPDQVNPPCAIIRLNPETSVRYKRTQSGTVELDFLITVVESSAWTRTGQERLDTYLAPSGASSVMAALEGTVSDVTDYAIVTEARNYGSVTIAGVTYYGVDFAVEVSTL